jgi:signal transduction histidine kinase
VIDSDTVEAGLQNLRHKLSAAGGLPEIDALLQHIVESASAQLRTEYAMFLSWDSPTQQLRLAAHNFPQDVRLRPVIRCGQGAAGVAAQTRRPVVVADYARWPRALFLDTPFRMQSVMAVPLIHDGELQGTFTVLSLSPRQFSQEDVHLLTAFVAEIVPLSTQTRLFAQVKAQQIQMMMLADMARQSATEPDADHLMHITARHAARLVSADYVAIGLLEPDGVVTWPVQWGERPTFWSGDVPVFGREVLGEVLGDGRAVVVRHVGQDRGLQHDALTPGEAANGYTVALAPLANHADVFGLLLLGWAGEVMLGRVDLDVIEALAGQAAGSIGLRLQADTVLYRQTHSEQVDRLLDLSKSALLASVGRVLRQPLQSLRDSAVALSQPAARCAIARLGKRVDDALFWHSLQDGGVRPHPAPLDLAALAADVVAELLAEGSPHRMCLEIACTVPWVSVDKGQLRQVLLNLFENAVIHSSIDSPVYVSVRAAEQEVELQVRDSGVGIAAEDLTRIFDSHAVNTAGALLQSPRIGLGVVRGLVEANGGRVWVESDGRGQGSTFVVRLARCDRVAATQATTEHLLTVEVREDERYFLAELAQLFPDETPETLLQALLTTLAARGADIVAETDWAAVQPISATELIDALRARRSPRRGRSGPGRRTE